jgi:hypothetical protein
MRRSPWGGVAVALALAVSVASLRAQLVAPDPDWREVEAPPAPALKTEGLIPLELPRTNLRFGVDPGSIAVTSDGIVRYVVVATSPSGVVNAMYEGIRCSAGEFKVYARHSPGSGWVVAKDAAWQSFKDVPTARHSLLIARTGVCVGHGPNGSPAQMIRDLRRSSDTRFNQPQ